MVLVESTDAFTNEARHEETYKRIENLLLEFLATYEFAAHANNVVEMMGCALKQAVLLLEFEFRFRVLALENVLDEGIGFVIEILQ